MGASRVWHDGDGFHLTIADEEAARLGLRDGDLVDVRISNADVQDALDPEILAAAHRSLHERASDYEYLAK